MDREGGLDEYLLKDDEHRIKELGPMGWALRWTLMQKPDVIARLRADAAALGLDQATIDKQWPTPDMMAEHETTLVTSNGFEQEGFQETAEQEMWNPKESGTLQSDPISITLSKQEKRAAANAVTEYIRAVKAAERYLSRGLVDSEEEGLKLAFIRAKERREAASRLNKSFDEKTREQFSAKAVQKIKKQFNLPNISDRAARKIAYNQWKRQQIEAAGTYEAWKETVDGGKAAARNAMLKAAGGPEAWQANRKAMYAKMIEEAETASTNKTLDAERQLQLETAIDKADRAIRAKASDGEDDYAETAIEEIRAKYPASSTGQGLALQPSKRGNTSDGDAWAALVSSNNGLAESRPRV